MTESVQQSNMTHSGYFIWIFISSCGIIAGNVKNLPKVPNSDTSEVAGHASSKRCCCCTQVMVAEIVKHYFPKIVEVHNYITSCKTQQKRNNWNLLNKKVFSKLDFYVSEDMVEKIVSSTPNVILPVLLLLKEKIEKKLTFSDVEIQKAEAGIVAELEKMKITEPTVKPHQVIYFTEMSLSATRQVILEKELQIEELQDILKNLWVKVSKLKELIQLKDKRIEHLTSLSEMY